MKIKITRMKNHIYDRRGRYSAALTALAFMALMNRSGRELTEFLVEKGIDPQEYFLPEAYEEALQAAAR